MDGRYILYRSSPYTTSNDLIHAILHGNIAKGFPEPIPRLVKIFISSTKTDFDNERQHLHEVVLPKLERYCNGLSLDLLVIDPHWQTPPPRFNVDNYCSGATSQPDLLVQNGGSEHKCSKIHQPATVTPVIYDHNSNCIDPHEFELQLKEIEECSQQSLATFFMCFIGHKYRPIALPTVIASNDFQQIFTAAAESGLGDVNLLRSCYKENKNLQPEPHYVLLEPRRASRQYEEELEHIAKLVEYGSKVAAREGLLSSKFGMVMSAVHQQTLHAMYCARQRQTAGMTTSPTQRHSNNLGGVHHQTPTNANRSQHRLCSPTKKKPATLAKVAGCKAISLLDKNSKPMAQSSSSSSSSPPQTPTKRVNRLIHQVSLQQAPTQQKIAIPRQTSVSTNYELMQQPVDQILCFIRQLEGVNFNNASVTRFFDVTPTTISNVSSSGEDCKQPTTSSGTGSLPIPSNEVEKTQIKQLYAPAAQSDIQQLIEDVILGLKKGNVHYFNISWSPPPDNNHQTRTYTMPADYIEKFGETVLRTLQNSIEEQYTTIQQSMFGPLAPGSSFDYPGDIVREAHSHLSNFRRLMGALGMAQAINHSDFGHLLHIRELLIADFLSVASPLSPIVATRPGHHQARRQPIIVTGRSGAGKSTLLAQVFTYAPEWLAENSDRDQVIRIVRQCGQSPSSNFASELLRSLCIQISIAYNLESHLSRSAAAHELSELAICFQELLKLRNTTNCDLLIILDDLHHLQSALQSSALLGWMPWNLPANVHFICSVALESESILSILRSRISPENFVNLDDDQRPANAQKQCQSIFSTVQSKLRDEKRTLTASQWEFVKQKLKPNQNGSSQSEAAVELTPLFANLLATAFLSNWESFYTPEYLPTTVNELVMSILDDLEDSVPYQLVRRICSYLTCTKYGLRETEIYSLVHETLTSQIWPSIHQANTGRLPIASNDTTSAETTTPDPYDPPRSTTSTWIIMKSKLRHLLKEYYVQGRLYYNWRSSKVAKAVKDRYLLEIRQIRATHSELASAFNSSFTELCTSGKEAESVREADELWMNLLYCGNKSDLKSQALLNIRFLNAIVQGVSVCYLKCILDAVRSQILDWDIEQLYAMLKHSVHVVTQDPDQLPVEALMWLVPFAAPGMLSLTNLIKSNDQPVNKNKALPSSSSHLLEFLRQCYRVCVEHKDRPLLHPMNLWLNLPVPPQVTMITSPWSSITRAVSTPDSQHLIVCEGRSIHFYHLPTKTVAKSFEGHKSTITCLYLSSSGKWLASGSDDNSVHTWYVDVELMDIHECHLRHRFHHHSAGVLCLTINQAESIVLSGSENGTICAVNLHNGTLITRLEHHKSMVTCLGINSGDDVLVSGSTDRTVVIWSLDTFCILNEILLMRPVLHMDISLDSTFLLLSLDDNSLQVRALTTGTGVHTLQPVPLGSSAVISYVRFAEDNCRCVVGYADGRLLLFDIHSARQLQTLNGHSEMITSILPQKDDRFLITSGGNKIIIWNFYPIKRVDQTSCLSEINVLDKSLHEINLVDSSLMSATNVAPCSESTSETASTTLAKDGKEPVGGSGSGRNSRSSSDRRKHKTSSTSSSSTHGSFRKKASTATVENHREPITSVCVARDGQYVVTGGRDGLVKIWLCSTAETHTTLNESNAPITCVDIAPNGQFVTCGSEDGQLRTWSLTLSMYLCKFSEHCPHSVVVVKILSDNKRVLSADTNSVIRLWQIDNGVQVKVIHHKPITEFHVHGGTCFAIGGKIDNCLKYWQVFDPEAEKSVSHSDSITCFTCTHSGKILVTGSQDMSLKVWETSSGKLTQVLVGHEGGISCVATAALDETLVVSGSQDCNLIVWDMNTGTDLYTLTGHNANVMGVILTPDGSRALSYSEDNTLQLWDIKEFGIRLSMLDMHHNIAKVFSSLTVTYLAVWLGSSSLILPIIKHHNNSSQNIMVDLPVVRTPVSTMPEEKSSAWLRGLMPSRNASALAARTLKREQSFDSFYFEHMLHRGQSVDDFRKIGATSGGGGGLASTLASPFGSREQLWTGTHDEIGKTSTSSSTRSRMISKLMNIGPKQKMLKKQQSMFACFPEFTGKGASTGSSTSANVSSTPQSIQDSSLSQQVNGAIGKKLVTNTKKIFPISQVPGRSSGSVARAGSQDKDDLDDSDKSCAAKNDGPVELVNVVKDSSICVVI